MAIKWKKWKIAVSAAVFFLGASLALSSLLALASLLLRRDSPFTLSEVALNTSFRDTSAYRNAVSNRLDTLLSMGAHYPMPPAVSRVTVTDGSGTGMSHELDVYYTELEEKAQQAQREWEDWRIMSEELNAAFQEDKNILYSVFYKGRRIYTNAQDLTNWANLLFSRTTPFERDPGDLPPGYDLLLTFGGGTALMYRDGVQVGVYGDGFYREGDWLIPGYENFTLDNDLTANVVVRMAVRREPLQYLYKSAPLGSERHAGELYSLASRLESERRLLWQYAVLLGAGMALLGASIPLRRILREAGASIAQWTGRIRFEGKILFLLLLLAPLAAGLLMGIWQERSFLVESILENVAEDGLSAGTLSVSGLHFLRILLYQWGPWPQLAAFWAIFLGVNDLRRGTRPWENSLFFISQQAYPFQRRAVRRIRAVALLGLLPIAVLIGAAAYSRNLWITLAAIVAAGVLLLLWTLQTVGERATIRETGLLVDRIDAICKGDLSGTLDLPEGSELSQAARELTDVQQGLKAAVEEQIRSERTKVELITNVSHDLKTPLTSIISYVDLLKKEEDLPPHVQEYVQILEEKAQRLRGMVRDVFEISKAASGELLVEREILDLGKLLRQTLAEMEDPIAAAPVTLREDIPEEAVYVLADGERLYRVFQNLIQNALQYSLEGSRVYVTLRSGDGTAVASVKNISRMELPAGIDFTERFVRGDASRTDGGSGLGLSIARTFSEACGGRFRVEVTADLFSAFVEFDLASPPPPRDEGQDLHGMSLTRHA